ncbi:histone-lysine N-methyltransferase SETMAR [Trichonephila clavata]|uniref:Histone-lysine N-methyltransferase SETMAR n=1 Tax=Trichonephila clavata TaxID=2740835 RepID=A0A8X6LG34_TRICU|nr:histone-lysine N-methyltransferase SETMAR [Trichonephila clavata]
MLTNDNKWKCVEAALEYLQAYETYGQEFLDLLSLETRLGFTIWHQKRRNNLVSGNVQEASPRDSQQEESHTHEGSESPSEKRSSSLHPLNNPPYIVTNPPYSSDLAPSDYYLPELKKNLCGRHFRSEEELRGGLSYLRVALNEFFDSGIKKMAHGMHKYINLNDDMSKNRRKCKLSNNALLESILKI